MGYHLYRSMVERGGRDERLTHLTAFDAIEAALAGLFTEEAAAQGGDTSGTC